MNGDKEKYGTGPWTGMRFSGSQGLKPNSIYTYGLVYNQVDVYYGFQLINSSVYSRLALNPDGVVQRLTWNYRTGDWNVYLSMPVDNCDIYGLCQGYGSCNIGNSPVCGCLDKFVPKYPRDWDNADWSNGCVRETPLVTSDCQRGDGFLKYPGKKLPDTRNSSYNGNLTLDDCHKVCLENCSCMAYANSDNRNGGTGCLLWFGELLDVRDLTENGQDLYIRLAASEISSTTPQSGTGKKNRGKVIVALPILAGILLLGLGVALYFWKKKKPRQQEEPLKWEGEQNAWILFREGRALELIDTVLSDSCYLFEVLRSIHIGLLCVQQSPEDRPSMSSVVMMLGGESTLPQPKEPGFFTKRNLFFEEFSSSNQTLASANAISITMLQAR
ncbi:hypothetical protein RJ639_035177 [Escallonia herrerae]|uniref:Apple domain-containing protein n=1 Tax=Escallonia herrerae TaxID=1293975 RepID=A0AA89B678_9ASTE|nr:hypothetical protein RJ639_035177 [Escallonia herrerae]